MEELWESSCRGENNFGGYKDFCGVSQSREKNGREELEGAMGVVPGRKQRLELYNLAKSGEAVRAVTVDWRRFSLQAGGAI